jgi:hypothetical protein
MADYGGDDERDVLGGDPFGPPSTPDRPRLERVPFRELKQPPNEPPPSSITPRGAVGRARYRLRKVPALIEQLAETLRAPSYRTSGREVDVHASGCELEVHEADGDFRVRLDHDGRAYRTSLRWSPRGSPVRRVGLWERLTGSERRRRRREDDAWSAQLAAASYQGEPAPTHLVVELRRAPRQLSLELRSATLPDFPWLSLVVRSLRQRDA